MSKKMTPEQKAQFTTALHKLERAAWDLRRVVDEIGDEHDEEMTEGYTLPINFEDLPAMLNHWRSHQMYGPEVEETEEDFGPYGPSRAPK